MLYRLDLHRIKFRYYFFGQLNKNLLQGKLDLYGSGVDLHADLYINLLYVE